MSFLNFLERPSYLTVVAVKKNILCLVTAEQPYQRANEDKVPVSWLTQNSANVNLLPLSHNSAVTDAQTDCLIER